MTETQRNLADVNERYQTLGDKLAERRFELDDALEKASLFASELTGLTSWMDGVERSLDKPLPSGLTAAQADKALKEHKVGSTDTAWEVILSTEWQFLLYLDSVTGFNWIQLIDSVSVCKEHDFDPSKR